MIKLTALWRNYFSSNGVIIRASLGLAIVALFVMYYVIEYMWDSNHHLIAFPQRLEFQAYDIRLRATMLEKIDPRIVIIDIDEKTLAAEGRWPLSRDRWALLLTQLFDHYKVKVVGLDVFFAEPDTSSGLQTLELLGQTVFKSNVDYQEKLKALRPTLDYDALLADTMMKYPVVLAFAGNSERADLQKLEAGVLPPPIFRAGASESSLVSSEIDGYSGNLKALQDAAAATGHILPHVDADGLLRQIPMFVRYKDGYYQSLSLATYRTYLDNEPLKIVLRKDEGDSRPKIKHLQLRDTIIPLDSDGNAYVPYRGRNPMFRYISATDAMRGRLAPGELEGKIAFVGTTVQGLFDLRNTPVNKIYPGVETHANMVSGYLDNNLKQRPQNEQVIYTYLVLILGFPLALALIKLNPLRATVTTLATAMAYTALNMYWWSVGYVLPIAMPLLMIGALYLLNTTYGFFIEARSRRQITGIFGTYVPRELVEEMAKDPATYTTKGESREMTVLFSDVRNFTTISEGLAPTALKEMMNAYLSAMTEAIQHDRGTIDKYIGDAIMAFWGAPLKDDKHAEHALFSALAMQKKGKEIGPEFIRRGWPTLEFGIGINCGMMSVGDMGSSFRRAYTVMGDAVNLASRLEGLTKEYGVGILVAENIVQAVTSVVYRELDRVRVKGKIEPISVYEPVGLKGEVIERVIDEIDCFQRALDQYRGQRWDDAEAALIKLADADPHRKVYQVYIERVANLRVKPPGADWDGVFTFSTK